METIKPEQTTAGNIGINVCLMEAIKVEEINAGNAGINNMESEIVLPFILTITLKGVIV